MPLKTKLRGPMPELIGHRGLSLLSPENTQASIECAAIHGIKWVELDVTMLGDHSLIMMHDPDLRLFNQAGIKLINLDANSIKEVDAGSWFSKDFCNEPLIDLAKAFRLIKKHNLCFNLEIKINPDMEHLGQVDVIYSEIRKAKLTSDSLIVSSFNILALSHLRSLDATINIAPLYKHLPVEFDEELLALNPVSIHCDHIYLNKLQAKEISKKVPLYCFTVNDTTIFKKLLSWGVSGVFCDRAHAEDMWDVVEKSKIIY